MCGGGLGNGFLLLDESRFRLLAQFFKGSHFILISAGENSKEFDEVTKEWEEHALLQDTMDNELNELNQLLEQKEV